ncbi:MAG: EFR1 family ferrodoxin [Clostridia bacterium]|nr:EFR1 family ferrodoxin [Clostridia bacterium]
MSIFYFSGTGNTKWIAEKLSQTLNSNMHTADCYTIEKQNEELTALINLALKQSDYIGFAFPLHGADAPRVMKEFFAMFVSIAAKLRQTSAKLMFLNTFGYVNGMGYFRAKKMLKKCGMPIDYYINFRLPNNSESKNYKLLGNNMPEKIKGAALSKIDRLVRALEKGRKNIQGIGPHLLPGIVIRKLLAEKIKESYNNFIIDASLCTKCMMCVKNCPTQSIEYSKDSFAFKSACDVCWRCIAMCPTGAISMNNKSV